MPGWFQTPPVGTIQAMSPTECIWSDNHKAPAWCKNPVTFSEQGYRIMYVFDEVAHRDGIKSLIRIVLRGEGAVMDASLFCRATPTALWSKSTPSTFHPSLCIRSIY